MIKINNFISSKVVFFAKNKCYSIIFDEMKRSHLFFKGNFSLIWNQLSKTEDYEYVKNYAKNLISEEEFHNFLYTLKHYNVITTDITLPIVKNKILFLRIEENNKNLQKVEKFNSYINSKNHILDMLYLQLTYNCNLTCKHCFNPKNYNNDMISFDDAKNIINEAYELGLAKVTLSGGECTINKDFFKIAEYVRKKHLQLRFLSNLQRLYDDNILFDKIVKLYPHEIKTSLYSMDPNIHDYITGVKGSQIKTLNVIKKLKSNNINVTINCFQSSYNTNSYIEVEKFAKSIGANVSSYILFINNKDNHNVGAKLKNEYFEQFYLSRKCSDKRQETIYNPEQPVCEAGNTILSVMPNLNITPCLDFNYKLGNYREISILDVWKNKLPEFRKNFICKNRKECFKFNYCKFCNYCSTYPMFESGFMKKSEMLCAEAKAYYDFQQKITKNLDAK